ncbi:group 4 capsule polysaccharide lipoprotein GfcB/YjbF [Kushneria sinocarnis]|uniref:Group 4 capsule polysaccharide lipoprotein GfcB/YjbF n=1 Tax=Kushneria sinocarnis TaxID=595502 RepID=A0A420WY08_9GAMM|nr:hypothetical protein [Kushneria sinocarnis]RKR06045.1 group 4 capsule polysaccharide lipoprotein GfcB/YjbF [Kushneria sinocarnis]
MVEYAANCRNAIRPGRCVGLMLLAMALSGCSAVGFHSVSSTWHSLFGQPPPDRETLRATPGPAVLMASNDGYRIYSLAESTEIRRYWRSDYPLRLVSTLHQRLNTTAGHENRLLDLRYHYAGTPPWQRPIARLPAYYRVAAYFETDREHMLTGRAELRCKPHAGMVRLPLKRIAAFECLEHIEWANGKATNNHIWRDARGHIVRARQIPWPGAPELSWEVIKPWW